MKQRKCFVDHRYSILLRLHPLHGTISGRIPGGGHTNRLRTDLDPLQVYRVHDGTLEELDSREVPLEQSLQF